MDLHEAQSGTPLQVVNEIFVQGNFPACPVTDEIEEGKEVEIGELADYEKAILLARDQTRDRANEMIQQANEVEDIPKEAEKAIGLLRKKYEFFDDFFWMSVKNRLNGKIAEEIGIRADWKVVNILHDEPGEKCADCPTRESCVILAMRAMFE